MSERQDLPRWATRESMPWLIKASDKHKFDSGVKDLSSRVRSFLQKSEVNWYAGFDQVLQSEIITVPDEKLTDKAFVEIYKRNLVLFDGISFLNIEGMEANRLEYRRWLPNLHEQFLPTIRIEERTPYTGKSVCVSRLDIIYSNNEQESGPRYAFQSVWPKSHFTGRNGVFDCGRAMVLNVPSGRDMDFWERLLDNAEMSQKYMETRVKD